MEKPHLSTTLHQQPVGLAKLAVVYQYLCNVTLEEHVGGLVVFSAQVDGACNAVCSRTGVCGCSVYQEFVSITSPGKNMGMDPGC